MNKIGPDVTKHPFWIFPSNSVSDIIGILGDRTASGTLCAVYVRSTRNKYSRQNFFLSQVSHFSERAQCLQFSKSPLVLWF